MNAIMTAWQCGGQGFESPQLHPVEQGVPPLEGRPGSSRAAGLLGHAQRQTKALHNIDVVLMIVLVVALIGVGITVIGAVSET